MDWVKIHDNSNKIHHNFTIVGNQPIFMTIFLIFVFQTTNTTVAVAGQPVTTPQKTTDYEVPSDYMALSLVVCLFCCWPIGIFALIASSKVN